MEELEDEVVEAPHASQKVQLPSSQENLDVLGNATGKLPHLKTPSNEGLGGDLSHWLLQLRDDLFRRLDGQDLMLSILIGGDFDAQSVVTELSTNFLDSCHEKASDNEKPTDEEVEAELTVSSKATNQTPEVPKRKSFVPKLWSTFTDYDLALQEKHDEREAHRVRRLFATRDGKPTGIPWRYRIVKNSIFDSFCALMVLANCVFLGAEVQMSIADPMLPTFMRVMSFMFTFWFLLELVLRVAADGCQYFIGPDWMWSWLDLLVVLTSIWEVVGDIAMAVQVNNQTPETSVGDVGGMSSLKAFRIIRITRVIKVVRLMRVFRFVMAFRTLIASIAETLKSLFWALMLLGVVIYVFAVLFTQAVNDYIAEPDNPMPEELRVLAVKYFGSLYDTMLSLFESIANGVSWNQVLAPLRYISPIWAVVYLFYIFFTYFTVLNVVTAVFCQAAVETAQNDHAAMVQSVLKNKKAHCEKLQHLFSTLGDQCTGTITFKMLQDRMNCPKVRAYFEVLGLDIWDAWSFFKLLDDDASGDVAVEDFLLGCLRLRGQASAIDMGKLLHDQTWLMKNLGKFQTHVAQEFHHLRKEIRAIEPKLNSKSPVSVSRSITRGKSPLPSSSATTPTMSRHIDELAQIVKTSRELRDVSLERKSPRAERLQTGEGEG
ncbi:unnamed protein product [Durusdinium trenchii]|uniref:Uncharacterized protein n=2 Tax=Durusdinium trenchii TaxID=1381693 RepID=A0ABP0Q5R1_9DINO